jgi:hypothetical protein
MDPISPLRKTRKEARVVIGGPFRAEVQSGTWIRFYGPATLEAPGAASVTPGQAVLRLSLAGNHNPVINQDPPSWHR